MRQIITSIAMLDFSYNYRDGAGVQGISTMQSRVHRWLVLSNWYNVSSFGCRPLNVRTVGGISGKVVDWSDGAEPETSWTRPYVLARCDCSCNRAWRRVVIIIIVAAQHNCTINSGICENVRPLNGRGIGNNRHSSEHFSFAAFVTRCRSN